MRRLPFCTYKKPAPNVAFLVLKWNLIKKNEILILMTQLKVPIWRWTNKSWPLIYSRRWSVDKQSVWWERKFFLCKNQQIPWILFTCSLNELNIFLYHKKRKSVYMLLHFVIHISRWQSTTQENHWNDLFSFLLKGTRWTIHFT